MKEFNYSAVFSFLMIVAAFLACDQNKQVDREAFKEWQAVLERDTIPSFAERLVSINPELGPNTSDLECLFPSPSNMLMLSSREFLITDISTHAIFRVDKNGSLISKFGRYGQGPGEFSQPLYLGADSTSAIYVFDGGTQKVQLFSPENGFIRAFRVFRPCFSMDVDGAGRCYLALLDSNPNSPLINIFDSSGNSLGQIGTKLSAESQGSFNDIDVCAHEDMIYVAWKTYPIVRKYSSQGKLVFEHVLNLGSLKELGETNKKAGKTRTGIRFWRVFNKIRVVHDGYYLLRSFPRLEILKVDFSGVIRDVFWTETPYDFISYDFSVIEESRGTRIFVLENYPKPQIREYYAGKNGMNLNEEVR